MSDGVLEPGNAHRCPTVKGESSVRYVCGDCIAGRSSEAWLLKRATHAAMSCRRAPFISGAYRSPALTVTDKRERHIAHSRVARWRTVVPSKRVCAGGFRHPHSCRLPDRSSIWAVMRVFSQPSVARLPRSQGIGDTTTTALDQGLTINLCVTIGGRMESPTEHERRLSGRKP